MNKIIFSYTYIHIIIAIVSTLFITSCDNSQTKETETLQRSKQNNNTENKFVRDDGGDNSNQNNGSTNSNKNNGIVLSFEKPRVSEIYSFDNITYIQAATKTPVADDTGAITYTSSNTNIAQVNAITGRVWFITAGTVIVTATKAATPNKYKRSRAQYTLYITRKIQNKDSLVAEIQRAIRSHGNNVDLNYIDTSDITDMSSLFHLVGAFNAFNGDISRWNVSNVTNMHNMFYNARAFNNNISKWTVSKVTDMSGMFFYARSFNQDISKWNVSNVTNMSNMFGSATSFNGNIFEWNVSQVTDMSGMFSETTSFNRDISTWNVSKVTNMDNMFFRATAFTYKLESWGVKLHPRVIVRSMFRNSGVTNFPSWYNGMLP